MTDIVPVTSLASEVATYGPTRRVQVLVAAWLASYSSVHTQRAYAGDMKKWLAFCDEQQIDPLQALRVHIDAWQTRWAGFTKEPAPTSLARRLSSISSWYDYLLVEDVLDRSPAAHVRRPKVDQNYSPTRGLTKDETSAFLVAAEEAGPRENAVVSLLLLSGLRCAELVLADADDLGQDRGHRTLDVVRKGGAKQRVPLSPLATAPVDLYLGGRKTGPLIVTKTGERISPSQVFRIVRKVAVRAGVAHAEEISPHSLRHTFATLSLDAGATLRDLQDAMGHRDPKTTMRYDRARGQLDRNPTYKLTEYLTENEEDAS
jgi:site-specific recombinase XerD